MVAAPLHHFAVEARKSSPRLLDDPKRLPRYCCQSSYLLHSSTLIADTVPLITLFHSNPPYASPVAIPARIVDRRDVVFLPVLVGPEREP